MNDRDIEDTREPADEPEANFCESCGEECTFHLIYVWGRGADGNGYFECHNKLCPSLFGGGSIEREMAELIVEQKMEIESLRWTIQKAKGK